MGFQVLCSAERVTHDDVRLLFVRKILSYLCGNVDQKRWFGFIARNPRALTLSSTTGISFLTPPRGERYRLGSFFSTSPLTTPGPLPNLGTPPRRPPFLLSPLVPPWVDWEEGRFRLQLGDGGQGSGTEDGGSGLVSLLVGAPQKRKRLTRRHKGWSTKTAVEPAPLSAIRGSFGSHAFKT